MPGTNAAGTTPPPKPPRQAVIEAGIGPVIKALSLFDRQLAKRNQKRETIGRKTAYAVSKLVNAACNLYDRL
jgi:hypothetical protein